MKRIFFLAHTSFFLLSDELKRIWIKPLCFKIKKFCISVKRFSWSTARRSSFSVPINKELRSFVYSFGFEDALTNKTLVQRVSWQTIRKGEIFTVHFECCNEKPNVRKYIQKGFRLVYSANQHVSIWIAFRWLLRIVLLFVHPAACNVWISKNLSVWGSRHNRKRVLFTAT